MKTVQERGLSETSHVDGKFCPLRAHCQTSLSDLRDMPQEVLGEEGGRMKTRLQGKWDMV